MSFELFLSEKQGVHKHKIPYYKHWISLYHKFCNVETEEPIDLNIFLHQLEREYEDWQVAQAKEAIRLYHYFDSLNSGQSSSSSTSPFKQKKAI